ncbi:hypothetical protein BMS3Bbin02_00235 [bacterium BMS3Bbin02]|nr:hypothetical protein BMS3Bbin02_00235 [bacterium BMS3Bbin02]
MDSLWIEVGEIPQGKSGLMRDNASPVCPQCRFHQLAVCTPGESRHAVHAMGRVVQASAVGELPELYGRDPGIGGLTHGDIAVLVGCNLKNPVHSRHRDTVPN